MNVADLYTCVPRSRADAKLCGSKYYFTGKGCPKGHISYRYTSKGSCCECLELNKTSSKSLYYKNRYEANKQSILEKSRKIYSESHEVRLRKRLNSKLWAESNREKSNNIKKNHKMKRRAQTDGGVSSSQLAEWLKNAEKTCYWCGDACESNYHVDHYMPLSKGGLHEIENLVIACAPCNLRKNAKDPYEFAKEIGRLF